MSNPSITAVSQGVVTKIASNVSKTKLISIDRDKIIWGTRRDTGGSAPTDAQLMAEGYQLFKFDDREVLEFNVPSDFYILSPQGVASVCVDNESMHSYSKGYGQAVAEGDVANHLPWVKVGTSSSVPGTKALVWGVNTDYTFPAAQQQMEVVSSNAADAAAGTGVRKVKIYYLDNTFAEKTEVVTLNGTTAVPTTATDIFRINYFRAEEVGSGGAAAGNIDIRNLADTPIYDRIIAGETASKTVLYTVPKDKVLYVTDLLFSAGATATGKRTTFTSRGTWDAQKGAQTIGRFMLPYTEVTLTDSVVNVRLEIPSRFPEGTDLAVYTSGEAGAIASVTTRGWLETK